MALMMVEGFLLIEEPGFDRKTDRRVRNGLELQPSALADHNDDGVAGVVGPDGVLIDLDCCHGGARVGKFGEDIPVG